MKREGYLYNKIISKSNIELAITRSSRGKTKRKDVKRVLNNIDYYVEKIYKLLSTKSYVPSEYKISIIYDNLNKKERMISKPNYYPDQIIQYSLMNVLEPILLRKMYLYSCGSIPGRGTSFGHKIIRNLDLVANAKIICNNIISIEYDKTLHNKMIESFHELENSFKKKEDKKLQK